MVRGHGRRGGGGSPPGSIPEYQDYQDSPDGRLVFDTGGDFLVYIDNGGGVHTAATMWELDSFGVGTLAVTDLNSGNIGQGEFLTYDGNNLVGQEVGGDDVKSLYSNAVSLLVAGYRFGGIYPALSSAKDTDGYSEITFGYDQTVNQSVWDGDLYGVSIDPYDGSIWAVDRDTSIFHQTRSGDELAELTVGGTRLAGVSVDPVDQTVWVCDHSDDTVENYYRDGTQVSSFAHPGNSPWGITIDPVDGTMWTCERSSGTVRHIDRQGNEISSFSSGITEPVGIGIDHSDGTLWIGSDAAPEIHHLDNSGNSIEVMNTVYNFHRGVSIDHVDGSVWSGANFVLAKFNKHQSADVVQFGGYDFYMPDRPSNPDPVQLNRSYDDGSVTAVGGSSPALDTTLTGVDIGRNDPFNVVVYESGSPAFDYAYNYDWGKQWDNANSEVDINLTVNWDTDPGAGNDVSLAWEAVPV